MMPVVDWEHVKSEKDLYRDRVSALSFAEKLQTLERLREREAQLRLLRSRAEFDVGARAGYVVPDKISLDASTTTVRLVVMGADPTFILAITHDYPTVSIEVDSPTLIPRDGSP
jgi:hypothetical protein